MAVLAPDMVADARRISGLRNNQNFDEDDICALLTDAYSELRDVVMTANEHHLIKRFDFTLPGGVGGNYISLPHDFVQGHSLEVDPDTNRTRTVRYLANWLERNRLGNVNAAAAVITGNGPLEYTFSGGRLIVFPPERVVAGQPYRLYYTAKSNKIVLNAVKSGQAGSKAVVPKDFMVLWLDASTGVTVSGSVATVIADQSGQQNDAVVIASPAIPAPQYVAGAINGMPALRLVTTPFATPSLGAGLGNPNVPGNWLSDGGDMTCYAVLMPITGDGAYGIGLTSQAFPPQRGFCVWNGRTPGQTTIEEFTGWHVAGTPLDLTGIPIIVSYKASGGGNVAFAINGFPVALGSTGTFSTFGGNQYSLAGNLHDGGSDAAKAYYGAEWMVWASVLSPTQDAAVLSYLSRKYGI